MYTQTLDILAFSPHPDDAELFCGGTLAKCARNGNTVGIVDLTRGELGSQGTVELRQQEADAATKVLGISLRDNLGLPDGGIQGRMAESTQLQAVVRTIRTLRPTLLFAPYWECRHPDHVESSHLVTRASFLAGLVKYHPELGKPHTARQTLYYQLRSEFIPSFLVDISEVHATKMAAVRCFSSQVNRATCSQEERGVQPLISSPLSLSALEARDALYGAKVGARFAEAFLIKNSLEISDPLAFFSSYPPHEALHFSTT